MGPTKDVIQRMIMFAVAMPSVGRVAAWLFAGLTVGGIARPLLGGGKGGIADVILGLVGGLLGGGGVMLLMGSQATPVVSILTAVCGSLVLVGLRDGQPPSDEARHRQRSTPSLLVPGCPDLPARADRLVDADAAPRESGAHLESQLRFVRR
jgi:uncharacterized membrane protein YeaQ/YmgE (transglycosylase-associated protein family)